MTNNVADSAAEIAVDLAGLRRDIAHLTETMRGMVEHQARAAGIRVADAVGDAQKNVKAASAEFGRRIERDPLTAVLIALGVGMIIGLLGRSHRPAGMVR